MNGSCIRTQRQSAGGEGLTTLGQAQGERAGGTGINRDALNLVGGRNALDAVVGLDITAQGLGDQQISDVGAGQRATEVDVVEVTTAGVAAIKRDADISGVGTQQADQTRLDVGGIVGDIIAHESHVNRVRRRRGQGHLVQTLGAVRRGEQQRFFLAHASTGFGHSTDVNRHGVGHHAFTRNHQLFDFIDRGHADCIGGHCAGGGGSHGAHRKTRDGLTGQSTHELDGVATDPVTTHRDIANTHASQRLERGGQLGDDLGVAFQAAQSHIGRIAIQTQAQSPNGCGAELQAIDGIVLLLTLGCARQGHAPIDSDAQVRTAESEVSYTQEIGQVSTRLQRGVLAIGVRFVCGNQERKVHALQIQTDGISAAAIDARKSVDADGTNRQGVRTDGTAVRQGQRLDLLFECKAARDLEEIKDINGQRCRHAQQIARAACHVEGHAVAGACRHGQRFGCPVDHLLINGVGLVDGHSEVGRIQRQAVDAAEAGCAHGRLQRGPLARSLGHIAGHHQGEIDACGTKANSIGRSGVHPQETGRVVDAHGE